MGKFRVLNFRLNSLLGKFPVLAFKFPFGHFSRFSFKFPNALNSRFSLKREICPLGNLTRASSMKLAAAAKKESSKKNAVLQIQANLIPKKEPFYEFKLAINL